MTGLPIFSITQEYTKRIIKALHPHLSVISRHGRANQLAPAYDICPWLSRRFQPCIAALDRHIDEAARRIARLG